MREERGRVKKCDKAADAFERGASEKRSRS